MPTVGHIEGNASAQGAVAAPEMPIEARIRAATLRCVARWGISKTTLDDVAREAGCARATIYRTFPGGKDTLVMAAFAVEVAQCFEELAAAIALTTNLEDLVVTVITSACRQIADHEALQYLLAHEPESILPFVSFDGLDPLLDWARGFAVPHLARFLEPAAAAELGEWAARLVVSYAFDQDPTTAFDLADADTARRFVRMFILPGIDPNSSAHTQPITLA